jgi:hypothetical protein
MGNEDMAEPGKGKRSEPVEATAGALMRIDLVNRPYEPVAEDSRSRQADGEEADLYVAECVASPRGPAVMEPVRLRPVEVKKAYGLAAAPQPPQLEIRVGREAVAVGGKLLVEKTLVRIRAQDGREARDHHAPGSGRGDISARWRRGRASTRWRGERHRFEPIGAVLFCLWTDC